MATTPIKISERLLDLGTYKKYIAYVLITVLILLILVGGYAIYRVFFPKKASQSNTQTYHTDSGGTTEVKNTYITNQSNGWSAGVFAGGITLGSEDGLFAGVVVEKKF